METDELLSKWWYYSAELSPGTVAHGIYPDTLPMLPRMLMRNVAIPGLDGYSCLDAGCMEGLVSVLLAKRGGGVTAYDSHIHCADKIGALKRAHGVEFDARLGEPLAHWKTERPQDFINLSGLLYHVVSPLDTLIHFRSQLKNNGLMLVSTNVIVERGHYAQFNAAGRMQMEPNTFWYPTIDLLDYWLRLLALRPIDALYMPHQFVKPVGNVKYQFDKISGYLSVMCRAAPCNLDRWAIGALASSEELTGLRLPKETSQISYPEYEAMNLWDAVGRPVSSVDHTRDSHLLLLGDES